MAVNSKTFEKQVYRIYELLKNNNEKVTWNDRIIDPDNPSQNRQIDISIKNGQDLTLVECRIHKSVQDVKWIEELIGRKLSMRANAAIGVSASGFTEGAKLKAKAFGIALRDFYTLTETEIQKWGTKTTVLLGLYEYNNISLDILFPKEHKEYVCEKTVHEYLKNSKFISVVLNQVKEQLQRNKFSKTDEKIEAKMEFEPDFYKVSNSYVAFALFHATVSSTQKSFENISVVLFDEPDNPPSDRTVKIESFDISKFEILKNINNASIMFDISSITFPTNTQFNGIVHVGFEKEYLLKNIYVNGKLPETSELNNLSLRIGFFDYETD
jgi:hypothetical protein